METGISRITAAFKRLSDEGKKGFIPYITGGDPSLEQTVDNVRLLEEAGSDIIELGVPFSDPLADGPVIQDAVARALEAGTNYRKILECVRLIREQSEVPILLFSYLNPLHAYGLERAVRDAAKAGADGFLVLDFPVEEAASFHELVRKNSIDHVCLVTPTSPEKRIKAITRMASGFVYCVSRTGVTGARDEVQTEADALLKRTRKTTELPLALGFGISTPKQAAEAAQLADAVVVGSAIVKRFHEAGKSKQKRGAVGAWAKQLVDAVKEV